MFRKQVSSHASGNSERRVHGSVWLPSHCIVLRIANISPLHTLLARRCISFKSGCFQRGLTFGTPMTIRASHHYQGGLHLPHKNYIPGMFWKQVSSHASGNNERCAHWSIWLSSPCSMLRIANFLPIAYTSNTSMHSLQKRLFPMRFDIWHADDN